MSYKVEIKKQNLKFSSAHFTIFGEHHAERLHGHNYYVGCQFYFQQTDSHGMSIEFNELKAILKQLCDSLDELILLPTECKYLKITKTKTQVLAKWGKKEYALPKEDTLLLPLKNITSEELSMYLAHELKIRMRKKFKLSQLPSQISVQVEETMGQSVTYKLAVKKK